MKSWFAICLAVYSASAEVVVLTKDNFDSFITENKQALVKFYAPWCGHCKKIAPEYEKASVTLEGKAKLASLDATVHSDVATKYKVEGYPTLKWFVNGEPTEYDGGRTAETIVEWIESMTGPAVVEAETAPAAIAGKMNVVLHGAELLAHFEEVANSMRKKAAFTYVKGTEAKMTIQHIGEDITEVAAADFASADAIKAIIKKNQLPLFGALDGDSFANYMEAGQGLVWSLFPMTESTKLEDVAKENREMMTAVAKEFQGQYAVTYTNTHEFKQAIEGMLGVTEFPKIVVQKKAGDKKKFIFEGKLEASAITAFIKDVISGKEKPILKSEKSPEEPQAEPVKVVTGNNLEKLTFTADKDVLLEIYAPWCGHCKSLEPEYLKVGKKVQKEKLEHLITIAKMDGTANDSPVDSIEYSGFPTIVYVQAGSKEVKKYDGGRTAKDIWKWIKENHSQADKVKEIIAANKATKEGDAGKEEEKKEDKKEEL